MNEIALIGFEQSSLIQDIFNIVKSQNIKVELVSPELFLSGQMPKNKDFFVCVSKDEQLRKNVIDKLDCEQLKRATIIHQTALIDTTAVIKPGTFIGPFCSVFSNAVVDHDCMIGPYSMIGHNSKIDSNCILNPGTLIAGSVNVGKNCRFGIKSTVIDKVTIADNVIVGAGSLINKNLSQSGKYVGSPARKISAETHL